LQEKDLVCPGDQLGVIEEFTPQNNCFEQDGAVYSSLLGERVIDKEKHQISIYPTKKIYIPRRGSIALAHVTEIRRQAATVEISHFKVGKSFKDIKTKFTASLSVMNLSSRFVKNLYDGVRTDDWLICKISKIEINGNIDVSLYGSREFGVIVAACFICGKEIDRVVKRNLLRCNNCGATQPRILSSDFPLNRSLKYYIK
jgi:exosome complex RNA-binding protein Csl4